jgi:hypothetical protein
MDWFVASNEGGKHVSCEPVKNEAWMLQQNLNSLSRR